MAVYSLKGNSQSDQAETSSENPAAGNLQMRILVEMQLWTFLLAEATAYKGDLQELRQSIADSIT
jgi:hypothetical protein